jgi:penicillin-binding protein A
VNSPLRRVAVACLTLFALLLGWTNYVQVVKGDDYRNAEGNRRTQIRNYEQERGPIAVADGKRQLVALSKDTGGQLRYLRVYPGGEVYAPVTGYYSQFQRTGIERSEDAILSGEDDRLFVRRLSDQITGRVPQGGSVVLTIQQAAQQAAYAGLRGKRGAVVALDPRTGAVLAMVSTPSFDPNRLASHDTPAVLKYQAQLEADDAEPLLNRATSQTYPPGSTFKVITAAAALAQGTTPETRIPSPTELTLPQTSRKLRNFGGEKCGDGKTSTLADALRISCNTAFGALGIKVGQDALRSQAQAFGFGDDSLELPGRVAVSQFSDHPTPPQVAQSAIGQFDVRVTPLQMALVAAGIGNGGQVMRPYLVSQVQAPDLSTIDQASPELYKQAVSREVADQLTAMMELVVTKGTGTSAQLPGVRVAGKTGTAQHAAGQAPHAWFIGFAPAEDPQVAVAVVVEDGGSAGSEATGGRVAAPIAKAVMNAVLRP